MRAERLVATPHPSQDTAPTALYVAQALEAYDSLGPFFPRPSARAQALGVARDTIAAWDAKCVSRLRGEHVKLIADMVNVCSKARRYLPSDETVGKWMLAPQTFLYGATPAGYLVDGGEAQFLLDNLKPAARKVSDRVRDASPAIERALNELLPDTARDQRETRAKDTAPVEVVDLMAALRASVDAGKSKRRRASRILLAFPRIDGGWEVRSPKSSQAQVFTNRKEALTYARDRARNSGGQLFVADRAGKVAECREYSSAVGGRRS